LLLARPGIAISSRLIDEFADATLVLVIGAGPIGLLAALLSIQRGYNTYVVAR
jgi:threonine dehydrogenase-like Zn-dependent dehydrogenase